jgi:hypothetical protein
VWRFEIGLAPSFLALADLGGGRGAFEADDGFKRGEPLPIVGGVGGLGGRLRMDLDLGR